jgi:hypothetical protein
VVHEGGSTEVIGPGTLVADRYRVNAAIQRGGMGII